jgi:hypothetical protein
MDSVKDMYGKSYEKRIHNVRFYSNVYIYIFVVIYIHKNDFLKTIYYMTRD